MDIKGKLLSLGLWSDLSGRIVSKIEAGEQLADWEVEASIARTAARGVDAQAKLAEILSGGADKGFKRRFSTDAKRRASLVESIKSKIKSSELPGDERKPYYGALRFLLGRDTPLSLFQAVHNTMESDFDEGLDLLMELRDRYRQSKFRWSYPEAENTALMGKVLFEISEFAPDIVISAKHGLEMLHSEIFHHYGRNRGSIGTDFPKAARLLHGMDPALASDVLEGLHENLSYYARSAGDMRLIEALADVWDLPPDQREAVAASMEKLLRSAFTRSGPTGAIKEMLRKVFVNYADLFPHMVSESGTLSTVIREFAMEHVAGGIGAHLTAQKGGILDALQSLVESGGGEGADTFLSVLTQNDGSRARKKLLAFWEEWTTFFSPASVAAFLDGEILDDVMIGPPRGYTRDLMTIFMAPGTRDLFDYFLREGWALMRANFSLSEIVEVFKVLADDELLNGIDPVRAEYSAEVIADAVRPELRNDYAAFLGKLASQADNQAQYEPGNDIKERDAIEILSRLSSREVLARFGDSRVDAGLRRKRLMQQLAHHVNVLGSMARTDSNEELRMVLLDNLLGILEGMPIRYSLDMSFTRTDVAVTAVAQAGSRAFDKDILGAVSKDIEEQRERLLGGRGLTYAHLAGRLIRIGHPQAAAAVELMLEDLLRAPGHAQSDNPELEVVGQTGDFVSALGKEISGIGLSDRGEELMRKALSIVEAGRQGRVDLDTMDELEKVDSVFYGAAEVEDPNSVKALLGKTSGEDAHEGGSKAEGAVDAGESVAMIVAGGAEYLAKVGIGTDEKTGLAEVRIGGQPISLWHAKSTPSAKSVKANRDDWHGKTSGSHVDVAKEFSDLRKQSMGVDRAIIPRPADTALAKSNLDKLKGIDSVAMTMEAAGVDRKKLIEALKGAVSIRRGFSMLEIALRSARKDGSIVLNSVSDAAKYLPGITALEIAMLSLVDRVPALLLEDEGLSMIYGATPGGIEWASDVYDPARARQGLYPVDPYVYMGMTEMHSGTNFTFFTDRVKKLLVGILRGTLDDRFFFDHLWTWNVEAAKAGLRMMKEASDPRRLINKEVVDLGTDSMFDVAEVAKLVGLLERVPDCLSREGPSRLYFKPFAAGIMFADHEGRPIELVRYHPHLRNEAFREVFYKAEQDGTDQNPLIRKVFDGEILTAFLSAAADQTEGESTPLEERAFEVQARFGISMPLGLRIVYKDGEPLLGATTHVKSIKMDAHELGAIEEILGLMPDHVWRFARDGSDVGGGIRIIRKSVSEAPDMVNVSQSPDILGQYAEFDKGITMFHLQQEPYRKLDPVGQFLWKSALAHEVGEAVFHALSDAQVREILSIYPWRALDAFKGERLRMDEETVKLIRARKAVIVPDMTEEEIAEGFITSYSTHEPNDLFAEAFMAFIFHGPEFRQRAESSPYLKKLYGWLVENVFTDSAGNKYEYNALSDITLARLEKQIKLWRHEYQNRAREHEEDLKSLSEEHGEEISSVAKSFETLIESQFEADEVQYLKEVSNGGFASAYFGVMAADEATKAARQLEAVYGGERKKSPEGAVYETVKRILSQDFVDEDIEVEQEDMDWVVDVEIFDSESDGEESAFFTTSGYKGMPARTASDVLTERILASMAERGMTRSRLIDYMQHDVDELEGATGMRFTGIVDEDLIDLIVDEVAVALAEDDRRLEKISRVLSQYVMPGAYTLEVLKKLGEIYSDRKISIIEAVSRTYRLLAEGLDLDLEPRDAAEITQEIYASTLLYYSDLMELKIAQLIVALEEGTGSMYSIAAELRVRPGQVDAFAEIFLGKSEYSALEDRSRYDGLMGQLVAAGLFYKSALRDIEEAGGKPDPAMISALERIEEMLLRLSGDRPSVEELAALVEEVNPMGEEAGEIAEAMRAEGDDDDDDPKGGGGGAAPAGGSFKGIARSGPGPGGASAADHSVSSAEAYMESGSCPVDAAASQVVMDSMILSGAVFAAAPAAVY